MFDKVIKMKKIKEGGKEKERISRQVRALETALLMIKGKKVHKMRF